MPSRAKGTRVFDIFSFASIKNGACYAVYDWLRWEDLLWNVYARVKAQNEPAGDRPGAGGDKCSIVLHWFFCNEFENAQEQAPTQVPDYDKFVDAQTLWSSLTMWRTIVQLTVAAWRLQTPFSLGITVVFSLWADASQMACCRIDCKVELNRLVALSYAHVLCAELCITWTTLVTHRPSNASFLYAVSPHISQQNCTSWQWCFYIFSFRVKQDGPICHKYRRRRHYC